MAVDIAMSTSAYSRRSLDLSRTSSLPVPHPFVRIPSDTILSSPFSPSAANLPPPSPSRSLSPGTAGPTPLVWREGPPITTEAGRPTKLKSALDCTSGRVVAVKTVAASSLPRELRQLEHEQAVLERLRGWPNVVQLLSVDSAESADGGRSRSLVLEFVSGGSVADMMTRFGGALPEQVARRYARGILQGLASVHAVGLVHCDVRARNVLVSSTSGQPKLCSFGLAICDGEASERVARKQRLQGTYQWMAPEVIRQEDQTAASDVWSFGCTLLEMLSGTAPWEGQVDGSISSIADFIGRTDNLPHIPDSVSPESMRLLTRCLQRDPAARPTAQELLQDPYLSGPPPKEATLSPHSSPPLGLPPTSNSRGAYKGAAQVGEQKGSRSSSHRVRSPDRARPQTAAGPGFGRLERPRSPDGHEGICKQTLQRAALARQQSGNVAASVQIWQREDEPSAKASLPSSAGNGTVQGGRNCDDHHKGTAPPGNSLQSAQREGSPLERTTSLQSPQPMPNLPPAITQLLNSPKGVKMGPLMRQISRDAHEFARLQLAAVAAPEASSSPVQGARPMTAMSGPGCSAGRNPAGLPKPGESFRAEPIGPNVLSPVAPASPRAGSPLAPSPRKSHRRAGSVQDLSPLHSNGRPGLAQVDLSFSGQGGSPTVPALARRLGSSQPASPSFGAPPQSVPAGTHGRPVQVDGAGLVEAQPSSPNGGPRRRKGTEQASQNSRA